MLFLPSSAIFARLPRMGKSKSVQPASGLNSSKPDGHDLAPPQTQQPFFPGAVVRDGGITLFVVAPTLLPQLHSWSRAAA